MQSLTTRKIVIFQEMSSMNVDNFRYLVLAGNFLNFRLCEIQLGTQCLLGENGPLTAVKRKNLEKSMKLRFSLWELKYDKLFCEFHSPKMFQVFKSEVW